MEAVILAGGLGTRLRSVLHDLPKPMAPIGDKPFLTYILAYLHRQRVTRAIVSAGYMHEKIEEYFGNSFQTLALDYSVESEPLGTGGAIKKAFKQVMDNDVLIINGDTFFDVNIFALYEKHIVTNADLTLALKPMSNFDRYGCVVTSADKVLAFKEKKHKQRGLINGGIYIAKSDLFNRFVLSQKFSFELDFMQQYINELSITSYISDTYFIDIGIPEDYQRAKSELSCLYGE